MGRSGEQRADPPIPGWAVPRSRTRSEGGVSLPRSRSREGSLAAALAATGSLGPAETVRISAQEGGPSRTGRPRHRVLTAGTTREERAPYRDSRESKRGAFDPRFSGLVRTGTKARDTLPLGTIFFSGSRQISTDCASGGRNRGEPHRRGSEHDHSALMVDRIFLFPQGKAWIWRQVRKIFSKFSDEGSGEQLAS